MTLRRYTALGFLLPVIVIVIAVALSPLIGSGYVPRSVCLLNRTWLVTAVVVADLGTALVYIFGIPAVVAVVVRHDWRALSHLPIVDLALWAGFIASCGWDHAAETINVYIAVPGLLIGSKAVMLAFSVAALLSTWRHRRTYRALVEGLSRRRRPGAPWRT